MSSFKQGVRYFLPIFCTFLFTVFSLADSQVRMVRLSDVEGAVQIDRGTGQGFEKASVNLPVTQGVTLRCGHDGFAAVELEDGSSLRMTPGTTVTFTELKLRDSGAHASVADVRQGMAYVSNLGTKGDEFTLTFGDQTVKLDKAVRLRLEVIHGQAALAVFKGEAQVESASGMAEIAKNQTATFELAGNTPYTLVEDIAENPYDAWDKQQQDYNQHYARNSAYNGSPYAYGSTDLNYYGNFMNVAGYGMMWQPFFTGAGWDPFMDGVWASYPGMGFGWASSYPWGWVPYHYGTWQFIPAYGWMWQPGGTWMGLTNTPRFANAPSGFQAPLVPSNTARTLVAVGRGSSVVPAGTAANKLMVRNNSAGLGIPRGSIHNLSSMSQQVGQRGSMAARVQPQAANPMVFRSMQSGTGHAPAYSAGYSAHASAPTYSAPPPAPVRSGPGGSAHK